LNSLFSSLTNSYSIDHHKNVSNIPKYESDYGKGCKIYLDFIKEELKKTFFLNMDNFHYYQSLEIAMLAPQPATFAHADDRCTAALNCL